MAREGSVNPINSISTEVSEKRLKEKIYALEKYQGSNREGDLVNPIPYAGKDMLYKTFLSQDRWYNNYVGEREIDIEQLETVQPIVQRGVLLRKIDSSNDTSSIPVVSIEGRYIMQDGNHTVAMAMLKGKKTIRVKLYEYK